jgi:hypothetical protein
MYVTYIAAPYPYTAGVHTTFSIGGFFMSRSSKYSEQVKAKDVFVVQDELKQEFGVYVKFETTYRKDAVRITGRAYAIGVTTGLGATHAVASVVRGASGWTNPHLPYWSILADIYDQLDRERVLSKPTPVVPGEAKLPW